MTTLVMLDTSNVVRRYVGGGSAPVLTHAGYLTGAAGLADALERFRVAPPPELQAGATHRAAAPVDAA